MNPLTTLTNQPAIQARASIPVAKRKTQWVKTLTGGTIFVGGFFLPSYLAYPWQVGLAVSGLGAFMVSQQLVTSYLKAVLQAVGSILRALGGKDA